ncbi:hypothetical protein QAD02_010744 [Eretmocerus hayati]|uniref:Uncharacterized protein n=1 Tax=Eretmocerus hayati TaxID=131215 RepID=A0ACC2NVS0_9HYME|nr:hypothetical protein QAD02_010744 [Eretmocerus hayati]
MCQVWVYGPSRQAVPRKVVNDHAEDFLPEVLTGRVGQARRNNARRRLLGEEAEIPQPEPPPVVEQEQIIIPEPSTPESPIRGIRRQNLAVLDSSSSSDEAFHSPQGLALRTVENVLNESPNGDNGGGGRGDVGYTGKWTWGMLRKEKGITLMRKGLSAFNPSPGEMRGVALAVQSLSAGASFRTSNVLRMERNSRG